MNKVKIYRKIKASMEERKVIDLFISQMKTLLLSGEKVKIRGFGTFELTQPKERRFYHPHKKEAQFGKPNPKVTFKTSKEMIDAAKKAAENKLLN